MAKLCFFALIFFCKLIHIRCDDTEQCLIRDPKNPCVCFFEDDRKIDISNLLPENKNSSVGRFLEADKENLGENFRFFFHGCTTAQFKPSDYDIQSNETLSGSLIVYKTNNNKTKTSLTVLGTPTDIKYNVLPNEEEPLELILKNKDSIIASFRLICTKFNIPYIQIIDDPESHQFTLNSPHACIIKAPEESSTGATMLIILLISSIFYFVGGGFLLYFVRGARGIEVVPNIDFWRSLPGLIKDGTLFLFGGCNTSYLSSSDAYDRI